MISIIQLLMDFSQASSSLILNFRRWIFAWRKSILRTFRLSLYLQSWKDKLMCFLSWIFCVFRKRKQWVLTVHRAIFRLTPALIFKKFDISSENEFLWNRIVESVGFGCLIVANKMHFSLQSSNFFLNSEGMWENAMHPKVLRWATFSFVPLHASWGTFILTLVVGDLFRSVDPKISPLRFDGQRASLSFQAVIQRFFLISQDHNSEVFPTQWFFFWSVGGWFLTSFEFRACFSDFWVITGWDFSSRFEYKRLAALWDTSCPWGYY